MADANQLHGACACARNQYSIVIPSASASLAQVFFDNSAVSRRAQASPLAAWLRIPLELYQSVTIAQFPDESHSSIKRTFYTPTSSLSESPTRKTFCGYCGSHLTQWNEAQHTSYASTRDSGYLDVTLGSLLNESLEKLEELHILPDTDSDHASSAASTAGLIKGATINEEGNSSASGEAVEGAEELSASWTTSSALQPPHLMNGRGMPFFEEMIDHSRLGRIRRQIGGHTSRDGTTTVQWEVVEIGGSPAGDHPTTGMSASGSGNKRQKLDQ